MRNLVLALICLMVVTISASASCQVFNGLIPSTAGFDMLGAVDGPLPFNITAGWIEHQRAVYFGYTLDESLGGSKFRSFEYGVRGLVVGADCGAELWNGSRLLISGEYLIPRTNTSTEEYNLNDEDAVRSRTWNSTETEQLRLQSLFLYPLTYDWDLAVGFRYEHFASNFLDPTRVENFTANRSWHQADFACNTHVPLIGFQYGLGAGDTRLTATCLVAPFLIGDIEIGETTGGVAGVRYKIYDSHDEGFILDLCLAYNCSLMDGVNVGVFTELSAMQGTFQGHFSRHKDTDEEFTVVGGDMRKNLLKLGGSVSIAF